MLYRAWAFGTRVGAVGGLRYVRHLVTWSRGGPKMCQAEEDEVNAQWGRG